MLSQQNNTLICNTKPDFQWLLLPKDKSLLRPPVPHIRRIRELDVKGEQKLGQDEAQLCVRQCLTDTGMAAQSKGLESGFVVLGEAFGRQESLGCELVGSIEVVGGAIGRVLVDGDKGLPVVESRSACL